MERGRRHRLAELLLFAPLRDRLGFSQSQVGGHRRRRPRPRHVPLLPRDGRSAASSSMARPRPPAPIRCRCTPRSTATAPACPSTTPRSGCSIRTKWRRRDHVRHAWAVQGLFPQRGRNARGARRRRLAAYRRCGLSRRQGPADRDRPGQGHRDHLDSERASARSSSRTSSSSHPSSASASCSATGSPYLAAILCIRYSMVAKWAESTADRLHHLSDPGGRLRRSRTCSLARSRRSMPPCLSHSGSRGSCSLYKELDPDDGELTRTRKVRRKVIDERYAAHHRGDLCRASRRSRRERGHVRGRAQGPDSGRSRHSRHQGARRGAATGGLKVQARPDQRRAARGRQASRSGSAACGR